jgi:hypothetical protein
MAYARVTARLAAAGLAMALGFAGAARSMPSVFPTGVTRYDPSRAENTYVLITIGRSTRLIDMDGAVVKAWPYPGVPAVFIDPALAGGARGHVLLQTADVPGGAGGGAEGVGNLSIGEVDWSGKIVWEWGKQGPAGGAHQHHDLHRLPNGDTLLLAKEETRLEGFALPKQLVDVIYEVDPAGKLVWRWSVGDHLDELGFTPPEMALVKATQQPDVLHVNDMKPLGPNHWAEAGDARFAPDNIVFSSRQANVSAIIDRRSGHIVWRLGPDYPRPAGPPARGLPKPLDQISGQHDVQMIPEGLEGAGNILMFDNQGAAGYPPAALNALAGSRVIEIDPVTRQIVWQYDGAASHQSGTSFFSGFISSARRLKNGNTLIDEGVDGRIFQVTRTGDIVWEYVNPDLVSLAPNAPPNNSIYRAQPVPYDWVPEGTPHAEVPVRAPDNAAFKVPGG